MPTRKTKRRVAARRGKAKSAAQRIEAELPVELRQYARRMRQGLSRLEKQLASAQKGARRRWAELLREGSHQLGRVEALGEREWRKRTAQVRRDAVKLLRRLEKAIEPRGRAAPQRRPAKRTAVRRSAPPAPGSTAAARAPSLPAPAFAVGPTPTPSSVLPR
jgi:hypothetical protein